MTKRNRTSEPLSAYLDGAMSPADAATLEKLLAAEPELARELEALRATRDLVRRLPREQAPDDFARRVVARLERRSLLEPGLHEAPSPSRRRLWIAAAAAVFLTAGVGTYVALLMFPHSTSMVANAPAPRPDGPIIALAKDRDAPVTGKGSAPARGPVTATGSGEQERVVMAKGVLAKSARAAGIRAGAGEQETIYVPVNAGDLTIARQGLEKTLFDLEVAPTTEGSQTAASTPGRATSPVYHTVEASPTQIKYVVANVSRSQLPAVVKRLEEFRRRQDQKQDELALVQTTLALAEAPAEQAPARELSNGMVLDRGAFLRQVLAESERAEKPAAVGPKAPAKGGGAGGLEIASAEPAGRAKDEGSNADYAQKVRTFAAARGGPGAYDQPGKMAKGAAPGDAAVDKAGAAGEELAKKETQGSPPSAPPIAAAPAPNAPAAPVTPAAAAKVGPPAPVPPPPADKATDQTSQEKLALADGSTGRAAYEQQSSYLDRADYLRRVAARASKPATAPATVAEKDRAPGGPDIAAVDTPGIDANDKFTQKAKDFRDARVAGPSPVEHRINAPAEGQAAAVAPKADRIGENVADGKAVAKAAERAASPANKAADGLLPSPAMHEQPASKPAEPGKGEAGGKQGEGVVQAPARPAGGEKNSSLLEAPLGAAPAHRAREALYNVCIILNTPPAAARDAKSDPANLRQSEDKDEEPPARE